MRTLILNALAGGQLGACRNLATAVRTSFASGRWTVVYLALRSYICGVIVHL